MRKFILVLVGVLFLALPTFAQEQPTITSNLQDSVPDIIYLTVGQTYTINVHVDSSAEFNWAVLAPDSDYPGKGVFLNQRDHNNGGTSADLSVELLGKSSTADIGVIPLRLFLAVRYQGGVVVYEVVEFGVVVE